ncbi:MAG TPA: biotin/lipoate A/B protein ligase family protein, partial [Methylomirabilota bacterium]|nr:biotin/lipoate A/B protein ligase family protein [Methylomirabilota bacterium]
IFLGRIRGTSPSTLRFFSWSPPSVSLGYGQALDGRISIDAIHRLGVGLVRRPTGGSAIYHDTREREVTYSVVARTGDFPGAEDLLETYRWIAQGLLAGLKQLGLPVELVPIGRSRPREEAPTFCFARAGSYEIEVHGKKLVGSAQRRRKGAFLQHGSILLGADSERLRQLFPLADPLANMITMEETLGRRPLVENVVQTLVNGMTEALTLSVDPGDLLPEEQERANLLAREKYATPAWTEDGRSPTGIGARPGSATSLS